MAMGHVHIRACEHRCRFVPSMAHPYSRDQHHMQRICAT